MATSKTPAEPPETAGPGQDATPPPPKDGKPAVGEYLDETPRTYLWPDGPQTVELGDIVALPDGWENDGRFGSTSKKVSRLRDNDPDQFQATSERQSKARAELHARLAKQQAGEPAGQE